MKTQLLEDIGQSAGLPPAPPKAAGHSMAQTAAQGPAGAVKPEPARRRPAGGVWRKKPATEPAPVALDSVFEEIAALEAQFVPPAHEHCAVPDAPPPAPASLPVEEATAPNPLHRVAAPHGPLFYFTEPLPASRAADPSTAAAAGRPARRYLLGAACVLSAALLALGGSWLYQERNGAASTAASAVPTTAPRPVAATPVEPVVAASLPAPDVPPLVMLEPDPPAAIKSAPAPKIVRAAKPAPASARRTPAIQKTRQRAEAASAPAEQRRHREQVRELARAAVIETQSAPMPQSAMAATLKACREHGYHASQCIRRQCGVGRYGFACRGR